MTIELAHPPRKPEPPCARRVRQRQFAPPPPRRPFAQPRRKHQGGVVFPHRVPARTYGVRDE